VKSKTAALAAVKRMIIRYFDKHTSKKKGRPGNQAALRISEG
jgi:hypothetical protein